MIHAWQQTLLTDVGGVTPIGQNTARSWQIVCKVSEETLLVERMVHSMR